MNKITFPLNRRMQGPQVADLHNALQVLLDRTMILANEEGARRELAAALRRDLPRRSYGEATEKMVSVFQEERRLQPSGEVDGPNRGYEPGRSPCWEVPGDSLAHAKGRRHRSHALRR